MSFTSHFPAASLLTVLVNNAISTNTLASNYFEPINEGAIAVEQFNAGPTPLGVTLPLFGAFAGLSRISTTASQGDPDDDIVVLAATDTASGSVLLTLSNRNAIFDLLQPISFIIPAGRRCPQNVNIISLLPSGLYQGATYNSVQSSISVEETPIGVCSTNITMLAYSIVQMSLFTISAVDLRF